MKSKLTIQLYLMTLACVMSLFPHAVSSAPGVLANAPLVISSHVDPNIMFIFDSSGSMNNILVDAPL